MRINALHRAGKRGSVLLHVLVTAVLVAVIAAAIMRMAMLRYQLLSRGGAALQGKRSDESALDSLIGPWNQHGECSSAPPDYTCTGVTPPNCGCTCTPSNPNFPTVTTAMVGGVCQITIVSVDNP